MNKNDLDQLAQSAFDKTKDITSNMHEALVGISHARTALFAFDGHNAMSYQYMEKRLELARHAITEAMAHIVCIATGVPSHDYYRGGVPNHISELRDGSEGWCE